MTNPSRTGRNRRRSRVPLLAGVLGAVGALIGTAVWALPGTAALSLSTTTVGVSDDTYTKFGMFTPAGTATSMIVGGPARAVGYLKFTVANLPDGVGPVRASLVLTPSTWGNATDRTILDAQSVASTSWTENTTTSVNAPTPGPVVAVTMLAPGAGTVTLDVSSAITRTGVFAFALTTPDMFQEHRIQSKEGGAGARLVLSRPAAPGPTPTPTPTPPTTGCHTGAKLVPTCGVLLGVAPAAHTAQDRADALTSFEDQAGADQPIYHAYHRGLGGMFPSRDEIAIAHDPAGKHILFLNWKPAVDTWAGIAAGDPRVDAYLDKLAAYIKANFTDPFFFTVHHEPENDVIDRPGSGMTASDFAAMYRHVILRLRGDGVTNLVSVVNYMAYSPWNTKPWFPDMYPGSDVVDWVAWDVYAYSTPDAYGYGDFAEMQTRGQSSKWAGIYAWASRMFPDKPLMVAEWGVWYSPADPSHQADVYDSVVAQLPSFPQIKALVYFDTPHDQKGRSSLIGTTPAGLAAYRAMAADPMFRVAVS